MQLSPFLSLFRSREIGARAGTIASARQMLSRWPLSCCPSNLFSSLISTSSSTMQFKSKSKSLNSISNSLSNSSDAYCMYPLQQSIRSFSLNKLQSFNSNNNNSNNSYGSISPHVISLSNEILSSSDTGISQSKHFKLINLIDKFQSHDYKQLFSPPQGHNNGVSNNFQWNDNQKEILMYYFLRHIISEWDTLTKGTIINILKGLIKLKFKFEYSDRYSPEIQNMSLYITTKLLNSPLEPSKMSPVLTDLLNQINYDKNSVASMHKRNMRKSHSKLMKESSLDNGILDDNQLYLTILMLNLSVDLRPNYRSGSPVNSASGSNHNSNGDINSGSAEVTGHHEQLFIPNSIMNDFQYRLCSSILKADAKLFSSCLFCMRKLGYRFDKLHPLLEKSIFTFLCDTSKDHAFAHYVNYLFNICLMIINSTSSSTNNLDLNRMKFNTLTSNLPHIDGGADKVFAFAFSEVNKEKILTNIFKAMRSDLSKMNGSSLISPYYSHSQYCRKIQEMLVSFSLCGIGYKDLANYGDLEAFESLLEHLLDSDHIMQDSNSINNIPAILYWLSRISFNRNSIIRNSLNDKILNYLDECCEALPSQYFCIILLSLGSFGYKWSDFDVSLQKKLDSSILRCFDYCKTKLDDNSNNNESADKEALADTYRLIGGLRYLNVPSLGYKSLMFSLLQYYEKFQKENLSNFVHWLGSMGFTIEHLNSDDRLLLRNIVIRGTPSSNIMEMGSLLYGMGRMGVLKYDDEFFSKEDSRLIISSLVRNLLALNKNVNKGGVDDLHEHYSSGNYSNKYTRKRGDDGLISNSNYTRHALNMLKLLKLKYYNTNNSSGDSPESYYSSYEVYNPAIILNSVSSALENMESSVSINDLAAIVDSLNQLDITWNQLSLKALFNLRNILLNVLDKEKLGSKKNAYDYNYQLKVSWLASSLSFFSTRSLISLDKLSNINERNYTNAGRVGGKISDANRNNSYIRGSRTNLKQFKAKNKDLGDVSVFISNITPQEVSNLTSDANKYSSAEIDKVKAILLSDCFSYMTNVILQIIHVNRLHNSSKSSFRGHNSREMSSVESVVPEGILNNLVVFLKSSTFSNYLGSTVLPKMSQLYEIDTAASVNYGHLLKWVQSTDLQSRFLSDKYFTAKKYTYHRYCYERLYNELNCGMRILMDLDDIKFYGIFSMKTEDLIGIIDENIWFTAHQGVQNQKNNRNNQYEDQNETLTRLRSNNSSVESTTVNQRLDKTDYEYYLSCFDDFQVTASSKDQLSFNSKHRQNKNKLEWKKAYLERHFRDVPIFEVNNYISNLTNKSSSLDYDYNSDDYYIGVVDNIVKSLEHKNR